MGGRGWLDMRQDDDMRRDDDSIAATATCCHKGRGIMRAKMFYWWEGGRRGRHTGESRRGSHAEEVKPRNSRRGVTHHHPVPLRLLDLLPIQAEMERPLMQRQRDDRQLVSSVPPGKFVTCNAGGGPGARLT